MGEKVNERKRKSLRHALQLLSQSITLTEFVSDAEQDAIDNCPENLQGSERFEIMESTVENLNDAIEKIEEAKSYIEASMK